MKTPLNRQAAEEFLKELNEVISRHALLKHPFYQLWNEGKLSRETLQEYSKQYYAHVRNFPRYLSAVHSRCDDDTARLLLLENLMEEEYGEENHPELWLRFAEALGVDREEVRHSDLLPETRESVDAFRHLTESGDFVEGVAALYAYESQVPEIARSKREGLEKFYQMDSPRAVAYFSVHEKADVEHSEAERRILQKYAGDPQRRERMKAAAETAAKAMSRFLDGLYDACIVPEAN